jgi:hypothetical protein
VADLLEFASNWLQEQRRRYASRIVTYVRGGRSADVLATIGKTTFEVDDGYGVLIRSESRDFLIQATDLVIQGQQTLPQRGDQIQETQNATTFVYEVTAPGKEPCWRWSDAYHTTLRIHTQETREN